MATSIKQVQYSVVVILAALLKQLVQNHPGGGSREGGSCGENGSKVDERVQGSGFMSLEATPECTMVLSSELS